MYFSFSNTQLKLINVFNINYVQNIISTDNLEKLEDDDIHSRDPGRSRPPPPNADHKTRRNRRSVFISSILNQMH